MTMMKVASTVNSDSNQAASNEAAQAAQAATDPTDQQPAKRRLVRALTSRLSFLDLVREDRDANYGYGQVGFRALAVHRLGVWLDSDEPAAWMKRPGNLAYGAASGYIARHYNIELPRTAKIGRRVHIAGQSVRVHDHAVVGDECVLRQGVVLGASDGDPSRFETDAPKLGRRVSVGINSVLVGDITVGDGAAIGPTVAILRDVPAGALVIPPKPRVLNDMSGYVR